MPDDTSCKHNPPNVLAPVQVLLLVKSMAKTRFELSNPAFRSATWTCSRLSYGSFFCFTLSVTRLLLLEEVELKRHPMEIGKRKDCVGSARARRYYITTQYGSNNLKSMRFVFYFDKTWPDPMSSDMAYIHSQRLSTDLMFWFDLIRKCLIN